MLSFDSSIQKSADLRTQPFTVVHIGNKSMLNVLYMFNWWICRDGQSITVHAPYWLESTGVILKPEICSLPHQN